jgi:activator of 2-hydroxyglutaryl-CoA dehydratase
MWCSEVTVFLSTPTHICFYTQRIRGFFKKSMSKYILAIDVGSSSTRSLLFNDEAHVMARSQKQFASTSRKPGSRCQFVTALNHSFRLG